MKHARVFPTVVAFLMGVLFLLIFFVVLITQVGAQGEFPLADGRCGPVPSGIIVTVQPFVARTGPMTQAPGSGAQVPSGRSFPVAQFVCDEGVTFVAIYWDGQQRWLPSTWPTFGQVWRSVVPMPTPTASTLLVEPAATVISNAACTPYLSPGLVVGEYGEVLTSSVNLRETPGGLRRGTLRNGDQFRVVGGPIPATYLGLCFNWWQVQTPQGDQGWLAEGSRWRLIGPSTAAG